MSSASNGHIVYVTLQALGEWQGAATHVREVVEGLRRHGWQVTFIAPGHTSARIGMAQRIANLITVQLRAIWALRHADVLYVRHHPLSLPLMVAAGIFGVPRVEEVNGTMEDIMQAHPWSRLIARVLRWSSRRVLVTATTVTAVSEELATGLDLPGTIHVVPNAVDIDRFQPQTPSHNGQRSRYVLFVGALTPWQGLDVIHEARKDPAWPENVGVVIAGDGVLRDMVTEDPDLEYVGPVPHSQVPDLIAGAMATLSPKSISAVGASPLKVYESLGCGVPVIVSDIPPQATFVTAHDCGLVIPPDDARALAQAVAVMSSNPIRTATMGKSGRAAVEGGHSWETRTGQLSDILKSLGKPKSG